MLAPQLPVDLATPGDLVAQHQRVVRVPAVPHIAAPQELLGDFVYDGHTFISLSGRALPGWQVRGCRSTRHSRGRTAPGSGRTRRVPARAETPAPTVRL